MAGDAPDLSQMEASLAADPDNMRLASEYRQAVIRTDAYDRSLKFFEKLVANHPDAGNAYLNYGFACVDRIPTAGTLTQMMLANNAVANFTRSIELQPSWIGYYTRGNSYLYWPKMFNRTALGVADLEQAIKMQKTGAVRSYHVRAYISLGDAYWRMEDPGKARSVWQEGQKLFPGNAQLQARISKQGDELKAYIDDALDRNKRVDTDLHELWEPSGSGRPK
jgi:tetratricopeptide (TPR) repeat protein